ncbi:MAG: TIGR04283 family arsenosugar biosynthesis glycosyltransferase [Verrucomicrobiales bacterium]
MTTLSVIIPTLNEAAALPPAVKPLFAAGATEVVVVDAASADGTVEVARRLGCRVVEAEGPGRARQLNLGAASSRGDLLLFLHADTLVAEAALETLIETFDGESDVVGGGFVRVFDSSSLFLKATCRMAAWRNRRFGLFLGDQGMFVRRAVFDGIGGFNEGLPLGEDVDFSLRMRKAGKTVVLAPPVISSARRFAKRGAIRQTCTDFLLARRLLREFARRESAVRESAGSCSVAKIEP